MLGVMQPSIQLLDIAAAQQRPKAHCQGAHGGEVGGACLERIDTHRLCRRQQAARLHTERSGDDRRNQMSGGRIPQRRRGRLGGSGGTAGAAPFGQQAAEVGQAACVSKFLDLQQQCTP